MKKIIFNLIKSFHIFPSFVLPAYSQGFINLNFESAQIVTDGSLFRVNAWKALPGWTNGYPSNAAIFYNDVSLGGAAVSIHDTNGFEPILQGRYSVLLQGANPGSGSASIGQTGQIPSSAQSLTFWGQLGSLQITFGGQAVPYVAIGNGPNYTIYGGDISAFAGQTAELRFTALAHTGGGLIDNIQFSPSQIPEPGSLALLGVSALLLGFFRGRNLQRLIRCR